MCRDTLPDYERMYHLLNRHRGQELRLLEHVGMRLSELYARLVQRDAMFSPGMLSWDRQSLAESLFFLSELKDFFLSADTLVDDCVSPPANTVEMEVVHGKKQEAADY